MNKYIQKLIREQFNIGGMDLNNNKLKRNMNIFNKEVNHRYYYKVLNGTVTRDEIKELNSLVSVAVPNGKDELRKIIEFYSNNYPKDSLNWLDVSGITDMSELFSGDNIDKISIISNKYNGDISKWDTSNVTDMSGMFYCAINFNQPIGEWDVSNVTDMSNMFYYAESFNQPIGDWNVSMVTEMSHMFGDAHRFNQSISNWDVNMVTNMRYMFYNANDFN